MKEERILRVLSEVDEKYIAEADPTQRTRRKPVRIKALLIAACLLLALTLIACAANWFGLRDLILPVITEGSQNGDEDQGKIGLTGYRGSPEWKALAQWQAFVSEYDPDGKIYQDRQAQLDSSFARYSCYTVYSREMADKMDEITAEYDLKLHTTAFNLQERPELLESLGDFMGDGSGYYTYMYEDGTFQVEGTIDFEDIGAWDFLLLRSVCGTFHDAMLDIGDISEYQETTYEVACGTSVTLALGKSKALILADLADSFVTVHIPYGSDSGIKQAHLEILADSINFAALTPVIRPQVSEAAKLMEQDMDARRVYAAALRNLLYSGILPDGSQTEMPGDSAYSQFAVADVDGDAKEELILLYDPGMTAAAVGYIIGYDAEAENIYIQLEEFPAFAFLENGNLKALSSHNQTYGEMWPYTLYRHLPESDSYDLIGYCHAEDKDIFEACGVPDRYPDAADVSGAGTVYYVGDNAWGATPIDEADYMAWLEENCANAPELELEYLPFTEESILTIVNDSEPAF